MALSRFWVALFLFSIAYLLVQLFTGRYYTIEFAVSGKKDDPLLQREYYLDKLPPELNRSLQSASDHKITIDNKEYQYTIDNEVLKLYAGKQAADGVVPQCKTTIFEILLPLIAYLSFFSGVLQLLIDSGAAERVAKLLSPIFVHVFPDVPRGHPSISYMTLNFAANFLGLDSAATPFGLKAMESLQELNDQKDRASNPQIMFMCLHAAGLTLLPTSIIGYRAAAHATSPADVMLPCIFTSFVEGAYNGLAVGRIIFPYILGMLVAISLFRNSGLFEMFTAALARTFRAVHVSDQIVNALPIAILRPFNSAGSRGFLLDAMYTYGADSFTGRLGCVFQCAAETTFYVLAVYFGSVKIKNTRYALSTMLLIDLICVCGAIFVSVAFFKLQAGAPVAP